MLDLGRFRSRIVATRQIPGRDARTMDLPADLDPALAAALARRGVERMYSHQAEMYARARAGRDAVITTGTASGKSLAFLVPILQSLIEDPSARAFLVYPTKALARDQLRALLELAHELRAGNGPALEAGVYDGDTSPQERRRIRERAGLVLTNPDMINAGLLPAHGRPGYAHLFSHLRWIALDELHTYRGAFGSHVANLVRRVLRVARHHGAAPTFLCSSATIANPREHARQLLGREVALVDQDGSPSAGKTVHFWQPPLVADGVRASAISEAVRLLPRLVEQRVKTIAFCRSRKEAEVALVEVRERLRRSRRHHDDAGLVAAYRAGYTPVERRQIERDLVEDRLVAVLSTNALELGIDIGGLEVVVQAGFPGTRASFWQQLGRAGRRGRVAHGIVILAQTATDALVAQDPDWLVGQSPEHAVLDPDNLAIQLAHLRCAAAEMPLSLDDVAVWRDLAEVVPVLEEAGELAEQYGRWHWTGGPFPAGDFSLRATDGDRFKVVDQSRGLTLTEMTRPQVYKEAHPRAIYLHDGQQYQVEALDLVAHVATVMPVEQNYYTQPDVRTRIERLAVHDARGVGASEAGVGDVRVDTAIVGFKMLEFHTHQNLGYEALRHPLPLVLETEAAWWSVPATVLAHLGASRHDVLRGMVHAVREVARLATLAERGDLAGTTFRYADPDGAMRTAIAVYDLHPGGLGFALQAFALAERVVADAQALLDRCGCRDGCPACTGELGLERAIVRWGLGSLVAPSEPPPALAGRLARLHGPAAAGSSDGGAGDPPLVLDPAELAERWPAVRARLARDDVPLGRLLATVGAVRVLGDRIVLELGRPDDASNGASPELARMLDHPARQAELARALSRHATLGATYRFAAAASPEAAALAAVRRDRLRDRLEDLLREEPTSEREANLRLAAGIELDADREPPAPPTDAEGAR